MALHPSIKRLIDNLSKILALPKGYTGCLFVEPDALAELKDFAASNRCRQNQTGFIFRAIDIYCVRLFGVFFQSTSFAAADYACITGVAISPALAEHLRPHVQTSLISNLSVTDNGIQKLKPTYLLQVPLGQTVKERIVLLLKRVSASKAPATSISPKRLRTGDRMPSSIGVSDVYLFPTGRAALYRLHNYLTVSHMHENVSVAFGRVSQLMLNVLAVNGARYLHFTKGNDNDLNDLEKLCLTEAAVDRSIQAVYVELVSASAFASLRRLADTYRFVLVVNDIAANFANFDFMITADVLVTDLVGCFTGNADDVQGGSLVLNPDSGAAYRHLKPLVERDWRNEVFAGDIVQIERHSRASLCRLTVLNGNAEAIAAFLQDRGSTPMGMTRVGYPKFIPGAELYMRDPTNTFVPGYGSLVSVEFEEQGRAVAFYTALKNEIEACSNGRSASVSLEITRILDGNITGCFKVRILPMLEDADELLLPLQRACSRTTSQQ